MKKKKKELNNKTYRRKDEENNNVDCERPSRLIKTTENKKKALRKKMLSD